MPVKRHRESGFTAVEVAIAAMVVAVMSVLILESLHGVSSTQASTRERTTADMLADRVAQAIARDTKYSLRVYEEGPEARQVLELLDLDAPPLAQSRLPTATRKGSFAPDPLGQTETGNLLLALCRLPTHTANLAADGDPDDLVRIDSFCFVVYSVVEHDGQLDLARWSSVAMARAQDVVRITDTERAARLAGRLAAAGLLYTWRPDAPPDAALCVLGSDGKWVPPPSGARLPAAHLDARLLGARHAALARNGTARVPVPAFARATESFPHGFELKIDGDGTGRMAQFRLVLTLQGAGGRNHTSEITRVVGIREF
jgi:type II secretory pathway pseudopilin PulG